MKLPYFKSRYYLSGIDWIISAIDYYMRLTTPAGNHSSLIVELNTSCDETALKKKLELIFNLLPLLNATQGRDIFNLAPYWKVSRRNPIIPEIKVLYVKNINEIEKARKTILNAHFKSKREHLIFYLISSNLGNYLIMTFDHKLFDARGAEVFLQLLSSQANTEQLISQIKTTDSPKLKDWNQKFDAGRDVKRHLTELSKNTYIFLTGHSMSNPPQPNGPNLNSKTIIYEKKETAQILEKSEKLSGFMMETPFLLAISALAIHKTISPDKAATYSVPMPIDMRKPGSEMEKILFNHLSFMFLVIKIEPEMELKKLIDQIRNTIFYNIEQELPEKLVKATRLARISPLAILKNFMKLPMEGKVASFAFANVGETKNITKDILGNEIKNISHMPRIPTPPGLGIFFNRFDEKIQFTLTWDEKTIEKEIACDIILKIKELMRT